ncbi:MAG: endonuclease [Bacteroidales bacterium]|nr:endonuclease [Bacteroidales bacterium]
MKATPYLTALMLFYNIANAQLSPDSRGMAGIRFLFYNAENLFDPFNDTLTNDDDFTPEGSMRWTWKKMEQKILQISRVIIASGGWELPAIVGLCEIENRFVLERLAASPLLSFSSSRYRVVHYDSPDYRGIDVGLLYRPEKLRLIASRPLSITLPDDSTFRTRDILYATFTTLHNDTLHIFINHWPSRRGGAEASVHKRICAATNLRQLVDSLFENNSDANILIAGDFNDEPMDSSVHMVLRAKPAHEAKENDLINLMYPLYKKGAGTHAFKELQGMHFGILDQIIVSAALYEGKKNTLTDAAIGYFPFLLMTTADGDVVPFRTNAGPRYLGGHSDHLPVMVDIMTVQ